jgi:hypothetical protein
MGALFFQGGDLAKGNGEFTQLILYFTISISFPSEKNSGNSPPHIP